MCARFMVYHLRFTVYIMSSCIMWYDCRLDHCFTWSSHVTAWRQTRRTIRHRLMAPPLSNFKGTASYSSCGERLHCPMSVARQCTIPVSWPLQDLSQPALHHASRPAGAPCQSACTARGQPAGCCTSCALHQVSQLAAACRVPSLMCILR